MNSSNEKVDETSYVEVAEEKNATPTSPIEETADSAAEDAPPTVWVEITPDSPYLPLGTEPEQEAFKCLTCKSLCCSIEAFQKHFIGSRFHQPCGHWDQDFVNRYLLKIGDHMKEVMLYEPRPPPEESEEDPEESEEALEEAGQSIFKPDERSIAKHVQLVVLCPICPRMFANGYELREHLEGTSHDGYYIFECSCCQNYFCSKLVIVNQMPKLCSACDSRKSAA